MGKVVNWIWYVWLRESDFIINTTVVAADSPNMMKYQIDNARKASSREAEIMKKMYLFVALFKEYISGLCNVLAATRNLDGKKIIYVSVKIILIFGEVLC